MWFKSIEPPYNWKKDYAMKQTKRCTTTPVKRRKPFAKSYNRSTKERKFHDVDTSLTVPSAGAIALASLFVIPTGTTGITRIGRRINVTDIFVRISDVLPTTTVSANTSDVYRFILYLDKQANGATATVTGILDAANERSFNNLDNVNRFRILCDKRRVFSSGAGNNAGGYAEKRGSKFISLNDMNLPVEYSGDDGAIDKIRSNNVGVLVISESGFVLTEFNIRVRFTD